ncbi:MAG TPA: helix-turn-helix domain-containing protein [Rhizomicrobium sp.]|nr:helix-turn-helix domain-containing protein [Rhizomicrobium sp.]
MQQFAGASLRRVIDRSATRVPEHAHDWPVISLFVLGAYSNETELGETFIAGPSAVFYSARAAHRNAIGPSGFEQIEIEFDPAWLGVAFLPRSHITRWIGGRAGADVRRLVRLCAQEPEEEFLRAALRRFLQVRECEPVCEFQSWVGSIKQHLAANTALRVSELACGVKRHPSWLGTAYRRATGEGLLETAARFRVEHAARALRETNQPLAEIAVAAGFCDQSHMNRAFHRLLGRTPLAVRNDRTFFRPVAV